MSAVGTVVSSVLLLGGAALCLLGALGLLRFPDVLSRLQAATKPQTLGLLLILLGTMMRLDFEDAATLMLVALFQVITAPVISQLVGRSAYRAGVLRRDVLVVDHLGSRLSENGTDSTDGADGAGPPPQR
ncbi:MAG: Na+/H+ antiporter subunit G [Pseudonocardiaceae bacterium]|nr:Na+/H+ antiporter subunit G [Pseudonocardiaceae bacterium]